MVHIFGLNWRQQRFFNPSMIRPTSLIITWFQPSSLIPLWDPWSKPLFRYHGQDILENFSPNCCIQFFQMVSTGYCILPPSNNQSGCFFPSRITRLVVLFPPARDHPAVGHPPFDKESCKSYKEINTERDSEGCCLVNTCIRQGAFGSLYTVSWL